MSVGGGPRYYFQRRWWTFQSMFHEHAKYDFDRQSNEVCGSGGKEGGRVLQHTFVAVRDLSGALQDFVRCSLLPLRVPRFPITET